MLEYLCGKVQFGSKDSLILEVGGVGFKLQVTPSSKDQLTEGESHQIFVHLAVREDSMKLFGFITPAERDMFEKLQTISGIGPALALNILSASSPESLYQAVTEENIAFFKKIKGVGPKMASRIVLELKGSLKKMDIKPTNSMQSAMSQDAIKALMGLGYQEIDAATAVHQALSKIKKPKNIEQIVCEALQSV